MARPWWLGLTDVVRGVCSSQRLIVSVLCIFFATIAVANQHTNLNDWKFQAGDNLAWAAPDWSDANWQNEKLPGRWPDSGYPAHEQLGWYRIKVDVAPHDPRDLGIRIGEIRNAYEIYAGGQHLGGIGQLPAGPGVNHDKAAVYRVPTDAIQNDTVVIALRVWGGSQLSVDTTGAGPYAGEFRLGSYTDLIRGLDAEQVPKLIFASLFLLVGLYFLYLYIKTRAIGSFLWFGLTSLTLSVYIVTQSQWKHNLDLAFLTSEKIEALSLFLFLALCIQLIWTAISKPVPLLMRGYQGLYLVFALAYGFAPTMDLHYQLRLYWQLTALTLVVPVFWVLIREVLRNNQEARVLFTGLLVFSVCAINDLLINMDLNPNNSIRLMSVGFLAMLVSMGVSLAGRFQGMLTSLETQVSKRTAELREVNEQLASANRSLVEMTRIDPLTGLLNRRGLVAEAEIERLRYIRTKEPLALVIADIDHFKHFNDTHGHACGDAVLSRVADLFRQQIRDIDRVARWGGEEFVLLFPGTDTEGLANIAEKLRRSIEVQEMTFENKVLHVTMTFGGTVYRNEETLKESLERADIALYEGKSNGRNRVEISR